MIRDKPGLLYPWIKTPFILGIDVAGEIVEVGRGVTHLKIGDRVVGHAAGSNKNRNKSAQGAFQLYTVMLAYMVSPIPDTLSFESAAVVPLGASTAACGLFQKDQLALELPNPSRSPKPLGKTVIIWGGATSVGSNAIQLAVAAGYEVITTSSPKNFGYVKKLGANQVFDYNSKTVVLTSNMRSRVRRLLAHLPWVLERLMPASTSSANAKAANSSLWPLFLSLKRHRNALISSLLFIHI